MLNHPNTSTEIAQAYIQYLRTDADQFFWAWEALDDTSHTDLNMAWEITFKLIQLGDSDFELSRIGAGPLENILRVHGMQAFSKIEDDYANEPKLKEALRSVWLNNQDAAYRSLIEILDEETGFSNGSYPPID